MALRTLAGALLSDLAHLRSSLRHQTHWCRSAGKLARSLHDGTAFPKLEVSEEDGATPRASTRIASQRSNPPAPLSLQQVEVGSSKLTLESQTLGWQAVSAVRAQHDGSKVVAALATCSSFSDGTIQVRVNEGSSTKGKNNWETNKSVATSVESIPLVFRKVFEKEFCCPLDNTVVLDLSILQSSEADIGALAINAASVALYSTVFQDAPPIGAVSVAVVGGEAIVSPSPEQVEEASINLLYAGRKGAPVYFHASGKASKDTLVAALKTADAEASRISESISEYIRRQGSLKNAVALGFTEDPVAIARVRDFLDQDMRKFFGEDFFVGQSFDLVELNRGLSDRKAKCVEYFRKIGAFRSPFAKIRGSGCVTKDEVDLGFDASVRDAIIERIVTKGERIDGRGYAGVRQTLFQQDGGGMCTVERSGTKLTTTVSVSAARSRRTFECRHNLAISAAPFYMRSSRHHIRALEYDLIQVGQESSFITENAFSSVLPKFQGFPYYVKVKCQALSMDGSFPVTNICASSISLANAGVPVDGHVAGVSAGILNQEDSDPIVLLDLVDLEERIVDGVVMATATDAGVITYASLGGVKAPLTLASLLTALESALDGNKEILAAMGGACPLEGNPNQNNFFEKVPIPRESRGKIIGPGGSNIKNVEALTGVIVSLQEKEESVFVYGTDAESCKKAITMILKLAGKGPSLSVGKTYKVKVSKIDDYGAVVAVEEGGDGWIHISEIKEERVKSVKDELSVGQTMDAVCIGKNARGTPQLSLKALKAVAQGAERPSMVR